MSLGRHVRAIKRDVEAGQRGVGQRGPVFRSGRRVGDSHCATRGSGRPRGRQVVGSGGGKERRTTDWGSSAAAVGSRHGSRAEAAQKQRQQQAETEADAGPD